MNVPAMKELARVLKAADPEHFDMCQVFVQSSQAAADTVVSPEHFHKCGTAACAIGYAASDPWFQERGLVITVCEGTAWGDIDTARAMEILGLDVRQFADIFHADHPLLEYVGMSATPADMVRVVEAMIAEYEANHDA